MFLNDSDIPKHAGCEHEWREANFVLASNPPQYVYVCRLCGARKTVSGQYTDASGFFTVQPDNEKANLRLIIDSLERELADKEEEAKLLSDKVENQRAELSHFNDMFTRVSWEKDPETGEFFYMSGKDMLKRVKRAEAKSEKWRLFALKCADEAFDFEEALNAVKDALAESEKENSGLRIELTKQRLAADTNQIFKEKYEMVKAAYKELLYEDEEEPSRIFPPVKREDECYTKASSTEPAYGVKEVGEVPNQP